MSWKCWYSYKTQPNKPRVPTLKLWFRKKKKRKLNLIFLLFRRWSQPFQPNNSNGCCPEMSWWHQSWSQHFSAPQAGHSLPPQPGMEKLCPHPCSRTGLWYSPGFPREQPALLRLSISQDRESWSHSSAAFQQPWTRLELSREKTAKDYPSVNTPESQQPGTACRSRCLAGSRLWLHKIIMKTLLCFPAHLAKAGDKRWQCPTGWGKGCAKLGLFQGWCAFQIWRGAFPCRCWVPKAYLETKSLPSPLGFQNSQIPFKEKCKTHLINMERNTLTKLSRSTRARKTTGESETDFQHFFHNNDQNLHNTKSLTCKCKHHYNPR